ncbi:MAG: type II secretion system minor pseudopilin GspJ [Pseudomonadota bacterium]
MSSNRRSASGFTLIEILVALTVFAIIGLISSQLLSQTVRSNESLNQRGERLTAIHRAMQALQRDVLQLTNRPVRDEFSGPGDPTLNALVIDPDGVLELSRSGWRNPLQLPRAEIQRVNYRWEDDKLIRSYWLVLDRAPDSVPVQQTVLEDVEQVEFFALDINGNEFPYWGGLGSPSTELVGIVVRITALPFGEIERVWEVPKV